VANASHELRSPLTVIRTEADVALADPDAGPDELRAMGEAVLAATEQTDALLESLLVLARSQRGLEHTERVDLVDAAGAAARVVELEAEERGIALRLDTVGAPPVTGDRHLLERLIGNLLENGVRHNHPGGFVTLTGSAEGTRSLLRVESSGPVVAPAVVARLTEPFERGARHAAARAEGGLVVVVALPATALVPDVAGRAPAPAPARR